MGLPIWNYPDENKVDGGQPAVKQPSKSDATATSRPTARRRLLPSQPRPDVDNDSRRRLSPHPRPPPRPDLAAFRLRRARQARWDAPPQSNTFDSYPAASVSRPRNIVIDPEDDTPTDGHGPPSDAVHPHRRYRVARDRRRQQSAEPDVITAARRTLRRRQRYDDFAPYLLERARPLSAAQAALLPSPSEILERSATSAHTNPPTPPLDASAPPRLRLESQHDLTPAFPSTQRPRTLSPDNGLGDRQRSASPSVDVWQVMRTTITPDETLPSASSSFASAAAATASASWDPTHPVDQGAATAPAHSQAVDEPASRDFSFEETMREMGIEVSSSSEESSGPASGSDSSDESMSDTTDDEDNDDNGLDEDVRMLRRDLEEQGRIATMLYDIAMTTAEGREQVESAFGPRGLLRGWVEESRVDPRPLSFSRHDGSAHDRPASDALMTGGQHFSSEIHARARDAASQTRRYFVRFRPRAREAGGHVAPSTYPRHSGRHGPRTRDASDGVQNGTEPPRRGERRPARSTTPPGSYIVNPVTSERTRLLDRDRRDADGRLSSHL